MTLLKQEIIERRVIQCIDDSLKGYFDGIVVEKESKLLEDLGADSLDYVVIVMDLEVEFSIDISDADMVSWKSVQDVINYITKKMEEKENGK
jgi:acyl carrier protein